jgi:hypothetical protein
MAQHDDATRFNLYIQSRCCCPGMCHYSTHSLSPIVILILILLIVLGGYVVGSIIFLRYKKTINTNYQEI